MSDINGKSKPLVIDKSVKFLLVYISGLVTIIISTLIIYYNALQDTLISLGIGICVSAFVMAYLIGKIKVNKIE